MSVVPRSRRWGGTCVLMLALVLVASVGCERAHPGVEDSKVRVFAASSLADAFGEFAVMAEQELPGIDVVVTSAGSQTLRLQIEEGAPAEIFVTANTAHLDALVQSGELEAAQHFTSNRLAIIVEEGNPLAIEDVEDLLRAQRLVVGAPEVPIGAYTERFFDKVAQRQPELASKLRGQVVSRERNVRQVRAKVEMGEADAAIVYRSDALSHEGVHAVEIPQEVQVMANYGLGLSTAMRAPRREMVEAFLSILRSPEGQEVLYRRGFEAATR